MTPVKLKNDAYHTVVGQLMTERLIGLIRCHE